jgi:sialate O-acetylesterase
MLSVRVLSLALAAALLAGGATRADVKPASIFGDNMVLQQGMSGVPVWGTADPGEAITVSLGGLMAEATADDKGRWMARFVGLGAGGDPTTLTITGKGSSVTFKNVVIGEVWICSGQSNMQWAVRQSAEPEVTAANAKYPQIRLFTVPRQGKPEPQSSVNAKWVVCSPETVKDFSAVAYHFGRNLHEKLGVPVGLISTNVGGTPAEAWTSQEALDAVPELQHYHKTLAERVAKWDPDKAKADFDKAQAKFRDDLAKWEEAAKKARDEGQPPPRRPTAPRPPQSPATSGNSPSTLYNAMIAPLVPFAIKGAIWYQGESNAGRAVEYRTLFPAMIQDWRTRWGQEFPFLFVQLAPWEPGRDNWPVLCEAQLLTMKNVPKTAMAVITDVGDRTDIHPKQKGPVGERLGLAARALAYGEKVEYSGPLYKAMTVEGNKAVLTFDHVGAGLEARGGELTGFTVAGKDGKFVPAKAEIRGETVVVSSEQVEQPTAVRFGWAAFPTVNLWNKNGLPASSRKRLLKPAPSETQCRRRRARRRPTAGGRPAAAPAPSPACERR